MNRPNPNLPPLHFALVFSALLVTAAGNTALQSILPVIGREIRIPDMAVAVIFSLSALFWTFSAPFWARKSDVEGRRKLMQLGVIGFGVSMFFCGLVIFLGIKGVIAPLATAILFMLARSIFGIFGSSSNPAAQAYVAARTSVAERTAALALLASAFGLGTIIGPAIAPIFIVPYIDLAGPTFAFTLIAVAVFLTLKNFLPDDSPEEEKLARGAQVSMPTIGGMSTGATLVAARETTRTGRRERMKLSDPRIKPFMIYGFISGSVQAGAGQAVGFLIIDRAAGGVAANATQMIALAFMAGAGATLLVQWGIIRIFDLSAAQLMRWGALLAAIGTAGIAIAPDFYAITLAFALSSAGFGFVRPGFMAGSSLAVGYDEQGSVAGAVAAVNGSCYILAPSIGIGLYQLDGGLPYWLGGLLLALLAGYAWRNPGILKETATAD